MTELGRHSRARNCFSQDSELGYSRSQMTYPQRIQEKIEGLIWLGVGNNSQRSFSRESSKRKVKVGNREKSLRRCRDVLPSLVSFLTSDHSPASLRTVAEMAATPNNGVATIDAQRKERLQLVMGLDAGDSNYRLPICVHDLWVIWPMTTTGAKQCYGGFGILQGLDLEMCTMPFNH